MDVVTPYGYGGPAVAAADEAEEAELLARYRRIIAEEFPCRGLVAEFIRFHPVLANHRGDQPGLDRVRRSQTVAFDLTRDPERLWNEMDPTSRNKARRAIKGGVVIAEDGALAHFESFHDNYLETMRRRDAAAGYHYSLEFFRDTVEQLAGMVNLFVARSQGHVVNAALILQRGSHAHYHFSGSDETRRVPGANNLLLYEVALWARSRGARTLHLGGGRRPGDTLFQFKASFSPLHLDFWTGTAIHLPEAYERLCAAAAARRDPAAPPVDPAFFPRYRA
jgi:lipid II:glycine glycyltransferase (peptidoglycan interpeptide bridge formation enzyme)